MIKHIFAAITILIAIGLMVYVYRIDVEVYSLKRVEDILEKSKMMHQAEKQQQIGVSTTQTTTKKSDSVDEKLKALTEKAGNIAAFEVSKLYRSKCSSCHGVNGEGGVGSAIIGLSYESVSQSLKDFKSGTKKNYVMFGLLQNLSDEQLDTLAKEVSLFEQKQNEAK